MKQEKTKYAEELESKLIELSGKEKKILQECIHQGLEMFEVLDEAFNTEATNKLAFHYKLIYGKLSTPGKEYFLFDKVELIYLLSSFSDYAEKKITAVEMVGNNPEEDEECLFLNGLYKKMNNKFLNYDEENK